VKLSDAEEKHRAGEYYEAATIYKKVYAKTPIQKRGLRGYIAFRMAECNRMINNTPRAITLYLNALRYNYPDSTLLLRMAQSYHKDGKYNDAIKYYNQYLSLNPNDPFAFNGIEGSRLAVEWKKNPTKYIVKRMDKFNSRYSEFSPMFYGTNHDQLYFTSSRTKNKSASVNAITGLKNNDFFIAKKNERGEWMAPEVVNDPISSAFDEGTPSFSKDGTTMYYTFCPQDNENHHTAEIYISRRYNAKWGKGTKAEILKDSLTALSHPAISPDGKYLYYVSDAHGGFGGKDIFRSRLIGDKFGPMENLGIDINTPGDELFPFVRDSQTLYFASDGHPGMGGLDLFKATLDSTGKWNVKNLKYPINSMADDFGITFEGDKEKGFFSSNRGDARGYDHIYSFEYPEIVISVEGIIFDSDEHPIEDATVRIVGKDGMNEKIPAGKNGKYRIELKRDMNYVMMAGAKGYLNQNFELKTDIEEKNETYILDFFLSPINKPIVIENIFYDFNRATLRPESKEALGEMIKILNDNPNITIELSAHTDRKGSEKYNETLAQLRAQSVVDYLIAGGITKDRLKAKGYGKNNPTTINKRLTREHDFLKEGDILTEEFIQTLPPDQQETADQINRRTEFKVLRMDYAY